MKAKASSRARTTIQRAAGAVTKGGQRQGRGPRGAAAHWPTTRGRARWLRDDSPLRTSASVLATGKSSGCRPAALRRAAARTTRTARAARAQRAAACVARYDSSSAMPSRAACHRDEAVSDLRVEIELVIRMRITAKSEH